MVMVIAFYTKETNRLGDMLNIFFLPDLSPSEGLEADLRTRKWHAVLGDG